MNWLFIILTVSVTCAHAQSARFRELKLKADPGFYKTSDSTIIYPVVITNNPTVSRLINNAIRQEILEDYDSAKTIKKALRELAHNGTINLSYEVTYNTAAILSINIYGEGCGAYCSSGTRYFNFDLETGKSFTLNDLLITSKLDSFINIVRTDKIKFLDQYKLDEKLAALTDPEIDSTTVNWAMDEVDNNCINSISTDQFSLSADAIEIMDPCEFPNAIKSQQPSYGLKYPYRLIATFLGEKFKRKVLK